MGFEKSALLYTGIMACAKYALLFFINVKTQNAKKKNNACKTYLLWGNMLSEWAIVL